MRYPDRQPKIKLPADDRLAIQSIGSESYHIKLLAANQTGIAIVYQ
jgi:hypothetical protein